MNSKIIKTKKDYIEFVRQDKLANGFFISPFIKRYIICFFLIVSKCF